METAIKEYGITKKRFNNGHYSHFISILKEQQSPGILVLHAPTPNRSQFYDNF